MKYIRKEAFAYIHGHEVGGTNPGLLEALAQTDLNLVLGVSFNQTVAKDSAHYWTKETGNLAHLINHVDSLEDVSEWGQRAKANMKQNFTWEKIVGEYEELSYHEVNILLSTYNGEQYLKEQVKSIQDQTYQDWQLLIRDDGSTDGTVEIIQELVAQDERIRLLIKVLSKILVLSRASMLSWNMKKQISNCFSDQELMSGFLKRLHFR